MAAAPKPGQRAIWQTSQRGSEESSIIKWVLITIGLGFALVFLLLPLVNVFAQALSKGVQTYWSSFQDPDTRSSIWLTLTVAAISVPLNLVFGLAAARPKTRFKGTLMAATVRVSQIELRVSGS